MDNLHKEDYEEPACVLCTNTEKPIPIARVLEKVDDDLSHDDYASAERHLKYWLEEAKTNGDKRGQFSIHNELMGLYRKLGQKDNALFHQQKALSFVEELKIQDSLGAGTCFVNSATVFDAFGFPEKSIPLFEKAQKIYEQYLQKDSRLGSLYNNMALALVALEKYSEAEVYYEKALSVMKEVPNGELEQAITYLNMADAIESQDLEDGESKIYQCLDIAETLLNTETLPRNGYYAFVCEKCAPSFDYYGYFAVAKSLNERAKKIYERS